jgi:hypothetical protein
MFGVRLKSSPWDRDLPAARTAQLFASLDDRQRRLEPLFSKLPNIDVIEFMVTHPVSGAPILSGSVTRFEARTLRAHSSGMRLKHSGRSYRLRNWQFEPSDLKPINPNVPVAAELPIFATPSPLLETVEITPDYSERLLSPQPAL